MFDTQIPIYGIMILLSLLTNVVIVWIIYKKYNFTRDEIIGALVYENIGIIAGAKILTYFQTYKSYKEFDFWSLGFSSYGGVIGALFFLILFACQFKKSKKEMLFTFMPSIPFMYAIGKIGCFFAGCCYGIKYNGIGSVVYTHSLVAPNEVNLLPIQLIETISFTVIFLYMMNETLKNRFRWKTLGISFILCGFTKFLLDYLRMSHQNIWISSSQIISMMFIGLGLYINTKLGRKKM